MQIIKVCFLFIIFLKSVFLKDSGVNVIRERGIQTTVPSNILTQDALPNTTVNQITKQTKRDGANHSLHLEHNLSDKSEQQNSVAIFVLFAVFTVLALFFALVFYLRVKKGFCKRILNQEFQIHEIVEPLNS